MADYKRKATGSVTADYKRILSYLYRYEKSERKGCCGFIKAEQKSGNLKMTVQIDDNRLLSGMTLKLCFYEKQEESWQVWRLCGVTAEPDKKEWQLSFAAGSLSTGFEIRKQSGVFLFYQESFYYGSVWIGEEIPQEVFEPQRWHDLREKKAVSGGIKTENFSEKAETLPEAAEICSNAATRNEAEETGEPESSGQAADQMSTEKSENATTRNEAEETGELKISEEVAARPEEKAGEPEASEETAAQADKDAEKERPEMRGKEPAQDGAEDSEILLETKDIAEERLEKMWENSAEAKTPVNNIFNPAFHKGYKISVQQLSGMGEEADALSGNQFLLKGYRRYQHLLAGKVRYAGEDRYCIGVPGIYENREKYMAQLYQFPVFLSLTENRIKTGGFGYWLHLLEQ